MEQAKEELAARLKLEAFPRSATYDPEWMLKGAMGPNPLWLAEALTQVVDLSAGMRVMDLGCGRAISSVFLAREFQLQIWATDLWISATDNWQRICAVNLQNQIYPIYAEAHALPFADGFFDAMLSFDAFHYFGTDDLYLEYVARFVRPGGLIAIVVPGVSQELNGKLPAHLEPYWAPDWWTFHSPDWWRWHWEKTKQVEVERADLIPDGGKYWLKWEEIRSEAGLSYTPDEVKALRADAGRTLGFTRLVARKK